MGIFGFFKKDKPKKRAAIIDVNDDSFEKYVIRRSFKNLVLVDFWAAWCAPCRQLGPILEKIAEDPQQTFQLAKLDTERNPRSAARYQIQSIPAVKAFRNGQVVNEFTGALPETLVRRFIAKVEESPVPVPSLTRSADLQKRLRQAQSHLQRGRGFEAFVILQDFPDSTQAEDARELLPLAEFLFDVEDDQTISGLDDLDVEYRAAAKAMKRGKPQLALDHLFAALEFGEEADVAFTTEIIESVFSLLGENSQIAKKYRENLTKMNNE